MIEQYIFQLQLQPHPEGGYYKETYRSSESVARECLSKDFNGDRNLSTAIYFLLQRNDFSAFHRIKSDECWHFYDGGTLLIHEISKDGQYKCTRLGKNIAEGELFQYVVPAGNWFASEPARETEFSLVGCTVAPGFDFADFEMANSSALLQSFHQYKDVIDRLCR